MKPGTILSISMIITAFLLAGCSPVAHRRYTWSPATDAASPASFRTDVAACFDVGYVPMLAGGGAAIVKTAIEDCMKRRGYRQVGDTTGTSEGPARRWAWEASTWPWPESPPTSAWVRIKA